MEGLDVIFERVAEGSARLLPATSVAATRPDDDLGCRGCLGGRRGTARELHRLDAALDLIRPFTERSDPFVIEPEEYAEFVAHVPFQQEPHTFAVAPLVVDRRWGAIAVAAAQGIVRCARARVARRRGAPGEAGDPHGRATRRSSARSWPPSRRSPTRSRRRTSTRRRTWITDMALRVRRELGLDHQMLKRVELAALFHDIGKIGIPAEILAKPGPLTEKEQLIETHPALGERILAPIELEAFARSSARATSAGTERATPTASQARRSPSKRGSSSPVTPSTR